MNDILQLRNRLIGALIGLARAVDGNEHLINPAATAVIIEGLAASRPEADSDRTTLEALLGRVEEEKRNMVPDCFLCANPCGRTSAYDLAKLDEADDVIHGLKRRLLAAVLRLSLSEQAQAYEFLFYKSLIVIGLDDFGVEDLLAVVREAEAAALEAT